MKKPLYTENERYLIRMNTLSGNILLLHLELFRLKRKINELISGLL